MGTILGDLFKNVGTGLGKMFDGEILDGIGEVLGGAGNAVSRTWNGALSLVGLGDEDLDPASKAVIFEIAVLAKMAKVDGRVDRSEIAFMTAKFDEWGFDAEVKKSLKTFFNEQKKDISDVLQCAGAAAHFAALASPDDDGIDLRVNIYRDLFLMAAADGELDENEVALLRAIPDALGLRDEAFEMMAHDLFGGDKDEGASGDGSLAEAYATLGVSPDASDAEVKKAWKKKLAAFHPDKIQGKDLDPEWLELANQKSAEINQAYETIKAARR